MHMCVLRCMCLCAYACVCVCICVCVFVCLHAYMFTCMCSCVNSYHSQCLNETLLCMCLCACTQKKEQILAMFKPLQKSIGLCMQCTNTKIIRCVHSLLSRLTSHFPTEACSSNVASKYEELENLYATVSKVIYEGLTNYEKLVQGSWSLSCSWFFVMEVIGGGGGYNVAFHGSEGYKTTYSSMPVHAHVCAPVSYTHLTLPTRRTV